jgi:DNA-directed RNA polymerase subunit RPC12/RpoP
MSEEVKTFFRHCPNCGRRFTIKLMSKKLERVDRQQEELQQGVAEQVPVQSVPIILEQNVPISVDIEEFRYVYKCKHCGHQWSEERVEEHKE